MSIYRGTHIDSVEFNRKSDLYTLLNGDGQIVAELKRHEYLSQPQLRTIRLSNGRHRRPRATFRGSPAGQPYFTFAPGALFYAGSGGTVWTFSDPRPAKPIEDAGIRAGEVIARRCWRVKGDRLHSTYKDEHEWLPNVPMTGDVRRDYGVHAFKEEASIREYIEHSRIWDSAYVVMGGDGWSSRRTPFAIGTISLWGEIVEHERGYRAEFAKIRSIDRVEGANNDPGLISRLHARYGVSSFPPSERGADK